MLFNKFSYSLYTFIIVKSIILCKILYNVSLTPTVQTGMKSISETHFLESFRKSPLRECSRVSINPQAEKRLTVDGSSEIIHPRLLSEKMRGISIKQPVVQLFPFELV